MTKVEEAKEHYKKGRNDYNEMILAKQIFEQAVYAKEYDAYFYLASMYKNGWGCKADIIKAIELNEQALKYRLKLSDGIEKMVRRNLGAYCALLSKDILLNDQMDEREKNKKSEKYLKESEKNWVTAIKQGEKGIYKYLCRIFYERNAEKCYKYSNLALKEIDCDNYEEYIPILYIRSISYGDIIENSKLKGKKKEKMEEQELLMLKELHDCKCEICDDKKYSEYRSYVISPYLADQRYLLYLSSNQRLKFLYGKCKKNTLEKEKYENRLFSEYKIIAISYIYNKKNEVLDTFYDIEKYYVEYLDENNTLTVDTINECLVIIKKLEKAYIESSIIWPDYSMEEINMPLSIFIFTTYSFLEKYKYSKKVYSYRDLYASFCEDLESQNGYIENRKNEIWKRREMLKIQNKINHIQTMTMEQNDEIIKQNKELKRELSRLKESNKKNTEKLEWEMEKIKTKMFF